MALATRASPVSGAAEELEPSRQHRWPGGASCRPGLQLGAANGGPEGHAGGGLLEVVRQVQGELPSP